MRLKYEELLLISFLFPILFDFLYIASSMPTLRGSDEASFRKVQQIGEGGENGRPEPRHGKDAKVANTGHRIL